MSTSSVIDSLQHVIAQKESALAAMAQPETMTVAVHDTVVQVASASLGWWAEFWRFIAQIGVAALALLGGWLTQRYFRDRDERLSAAVTAGAFLRPIERIVASFQGIAAKIENKGYQESGPVILRSDIESLQVGLNDLFGVEKSQLNHLRRGGAEKRLVEAREGAQSIFDQIYKLSVRWYPENQVGSNYKFGEMPGMGAVFGQFDLFASSIRTHHLPKFETLAHDLARWAAPGALPER